MEFVQIRKRNFFSIGEKTGYEESVEIRLFLAFQHNYFTAVELQHSFRAIGVVLIGQKHFFYRVFKFGGNGFATEVGGNENAL